MPSTYYEQGRRDAENGELNQLFYHTYHDYKRGYDDGINGPSRRSRAPLIISVALIGILGASAGWVARDRGLLASQATSTPLVVTATLAIPTPTFPFTIATEGPTAAPTAASDLQVGGAATVATGGDPLRVRSRPTTDGDRLGSLPNGAAVTIVGGPQDAEGRIWWEVQTPSLTGWVVGEFLAVAP
ncbi:MAG TPA: SH3 domain-containing protein [Herpetosiphonaceae bacterium]